MATSTSDTTPNTIVLIHGFWVTPRAWDDWKKRFEAKGYTVLAPAYPGFEVEVEALRADPTPIERLEVPEIIDMLENMIGKLDRPPIIMGHSAGGAFTQILLDLQMPRTAIRKLISDNAAQFLNLAVSEKAAQDAA